MKFSGLLCILILQAMLATAQTLRSYVEKNYTIIRSLDVNDTDYADLDAIGLAIGDKRVIMLGEQDHGDAPSFLAKTRLVKYLHEKKGFNVLAFESDFFSLTEGQREIMNDTINLRKYLQGNIFPIWTYCDACADLFYNYLPQSLISGKPITVTGFDNQLHGAYSKGRLLPFLDSVLIAGQFPHPRFAFLKKEVMGWTDSLMSNYGRIFAAKALYDAASYYFNELINVYTQQHDSGYVYRLLHSLRGFNDASAASKDYVMSYEFRDAQMAANLNWLVNVKYKNEKIIVWAASAHIMNRSKEIIGKNYFSSMGTEFMKQPSNAAQTYILGFASRQGTAGRITMPNGIYTVRTPGKESFEKWFSKTAYAFIDFTEYNKLHPDPSSFYMQGIDHSWNGKAAWTKGFDGIFYIREMYPCKALQ
ncbi:MAG: erythromycin esterase family protein [Bacteroidota bacterium]